MILYMMFGHIISWTNLNTSIVYISLDRVFFFFMPWFFYKSGVFYNGKSAKEQWNNRNKLLVPYFFWGVLGIFTYYLRNIEDLDLSKLIVQPVMSLFFYGTFEGNSALWFLLSLLIVKCTYPLLILKMKNWQIVALTLIITIGIVITKVNNITIFPEYLNNSIAGLLFYVIGVEMRDEQYNKKIFSLSALIFISILFYMPSRISFYHLRLIEGSVFLWIIASISGIILVNNLANILFKRYSERKTLLMYIGENSMFFYVSHFIIGNIIYVLLKYFKMTPENNYLMFGIYLFAFILFLPIGSKLFKCKNLKIFVGG